MVQQLFTWETYPTTKPATGTYYQDDQTGSGIGNAWYDGGGDQWYTDQTKAVPINAETRLFAMPAKLQPVAAVKDDAGHWYVVPAELESEFYSMLEKGNADEYEAFGDKFDEYRTGGALSLVTLYAEIKK